MCRRVKNSTGYWITFAVCAAAATVPLLVTATLPMADLPEHLAQVAIWKHYGDACHRFAELFELHYATPYLLGYVLTRLLATVLTVTAATKVVVWLAIVLLPLSMRALLLRGGGDPWLSLLGFPLAYGYSFYWGFLNFALATPLAILSVALLCDGRARTRTVVGVLLMASHALLFAFVAAVTVAVAVVRRSWRLLLPLVPGALLFAWFLVQRQTTEQTITWKLSLSRLTELPSVLFANAWEPWGLVLLGAMIVAVLLRTAGVPPAEAQASRLRPWRGDAATSAAGTAAVRWGFVGVASLAYLFLPFGMAGTAYVYPRFALFVAIAALLLCRGGPRVVVVGIVLVWMGVLTGRFARFDAEAREVDPLLERIPPARRVAQFNVHPFSEHVPGPVFWHTGALYQVRRGGIAAWSFASLESWYPSIVRFRRGAEPVITSRTTPAEGIDWRGVAQYDYLLVRGGDPRRSPFRDAPVPLALTARSGSWWLFETPRARAPQRTCAPLGE